MLKVMTIVGTRPELIKLSRVIAELERQFEHILVHTGQNFSDELNKVFFEDLEIKQPDHYLNVAEQSPSATIGNVITRIDTILEQEKPDAVLIYGDTNSCLSGITVKRRKIPLFHMEAGNRGFDERVPEEINRRIIDHISDINMPLTEHAKQYLLREGIKPETIFKTGSCMHEVLEYYEDSINKSNVLDKLSLIPDGYFLLSSHREENVDSPDRLRSLIDSLNALVKHYDMPVIFSVHPRTKNRLDSASYEGLDERVRFMKAMGFHDYIKLQQHAACVISDSGTIFEEASLLGVPAVTIRQCHERPEGIDKGILMMSEIIPDRLLDAVRIVRDQHPRIDKSDLHLEDYSGGKVSVKVTRIIQGYTDYVRRTVWKEC